MGDRCEFSLRLVKHLASVMLLVGLIYLSGVIASGILQSESNATDLYGLLLTYTLQFMRYTVILSLPFTVFNFLGVVFINVFTTRPKFQQSHLLAPFLCFRVVTRGMYPNLVKENVRHNLEICEKLGLNNFVIQVVTDETTQLHTTSRSKEIVVPANYKTANNTLFKARSLQYALEPGVNILDPEDWIIHLDEETLLTEDVVIGIIDFVTSGKHQFGQGVITYGKGRVVNWITTLAESLRVGIDYGCYRFTLGVLHRPVFSWKGAFMVANAGAEMEVSFDFGPEGSIAEDCFFSCIAFRKGYSFGFVEGEMLEEGTFTLMDFIQQRRRWMHGILLTAISKQIPLQYKIGPILLTVSNIAMPINMLMLPIGVGLRLPLSPLLVCIYSFTLGTFMYLYLLGTILTFCFQQQNSFFKCCLLLMATLPCGLMACLLESVSSLLVFWIPQTSKNTSTFSFYIVNKDGMVANK